MKSKKITLSVLAVLFAFFFVSCSKDDDKKPTVDLVVGSYAFTAESIWSTAETNWDLVDTLTITKVDDQTVAITGLIPYDSLDAGEMVAVLNPLTAKVDLATMTFKIPVGQALTKAKTNGYVLHFYPGDPATLNSDYEIDVTDDLFVTGTIKDNGDIKLIGPWGIKWIDPVGDFDGKWWWDFYKVTNLIKL